jgi:hypothetical protein
MMENEELMKPNEVANEIVQDISSYMPDIIQKIESSDDFSEQDFPTREIEGRLMYEIQDAKISMYNMHMELQDTNFPLDSAKDFSDKDKFRQLLEWIEKHS